MQGVLDECADLVLTLRGGATVAVNKFTMLSNCRVLRDLRDSFDPPMPGHMHIPNIDAATLRASVDVIHGLRGVAELDLQETVDCIAGFALLDCDMHAHALLARMWYHVATLTDAIEFSRYFLADPVYRAPYLNKVYTSSWPEFARIFEHTDLSVSTATELMRVLPKRFNPFFVFRDLLDRIGCTQPHVIALLGAWKSGVYYHPHEMLLCLKHVLRRLHHGEFRATLETIADALDCVDPVAYRVTPGTTLSLPHTHSTLTVMEHVNRKKFRVRVGTWLDIRYDTARGTIDADIDGSVFDSEAFHVKMSAVEEDATGRLVLFEVSRFFEDTHVAVREQCDALKSQSLRYLRFDIVHAPVTF